MPQSSIFDRRPLGRLPTRRRRRRPPLIWRLLGAAFLVGLVMAIGAIGTNAFGMGDRFQHQLDKVALLIDPPPDRSIDPIVTVTARPEPSASPSSPVVASISPSASAGPSAPPQPVRKAVDVNIAKDPKKVFAHELKTDQCAPAGVQTALALLRLGDTSNDFQRKIDSRIGEWESWRDSHNGGWGPDAIRLALKAYGASGYQVRAYESRRDAIFDAAVAIGTLHKPVILLAWKGAHTWVMSGFRADADPTVFPNAKVSGAYILDPWYPNISRIWGPSDPPGHFDDNANLAANFLPWKRPEGRYPDRDNKFIVVIPTR